MHITGAPTWVIVRRMTVTLSAVPVGLTSGDPVAVHTLVTLGDSTPVGLGDPLPGGGWRGFPALLATALRATLINPSRPGARMAGIRREQLPAAIAALPPGGPSVAVLFAGMNDTLRSDFDPVALYADCTAIVEELRQAGAYVILARFHDHTRVFRLPGPLRRALLRRITELNEAIDAVAATDPTGVGVLDLDVLPGGYDRAAWSVDRLHPSERGHRLLAAGLGELLVGAGYAVPEPVSRECAGGRTVTAAQRTAWLLFKGVPWLVCRGGDLGPVIVAAMLDGRRAGGPCVADPATPHTGHPTADQRRAS